MLSLGVILYLAARTLPRIDDREEAGLGFKTHWFVALLERADERLTAVREKMLRRAGVMVLKISNDINSRLAKIKKVNEKESVLPDMSGENKGE
ncbi:MAG TPA: hypothetical protein VNK70_02380 [Candidatus Paceibacterota bacterium]|nr:hypothetical protein [Candidatus Paceibacterota bacterium]